MTPRAWGRSVARDEDDDPRLGQFISTAIDIRFALTAGAFAARVRECAGAAGTTAAEFASRASLDDLYLATACAAGDPDAWAECEAKHFAFIRAFAHRFLPDAAALDLADQVIADLWQRGKIGRYAGRSTLRTWLGSVVAHAAVNARRAAHSADARPAIDMPTPADGHAGDAPAERLLAGLVIRAISTLPPEEKLLLQLYYEQGLTLDEMEGLMRASKATLSRRLKALREKLRRAVDDLAARSAGLSARSAREGVMLERVEFDLSALLRPEAVVEGSRRDGV